MNAVLPGAKQNLQSPTAGFMSSVLGGAVHSLLVSRSGWEDEVVVPLGFMPILTLSKVWQAPGLELLGYRSQKFATLLSPSAFANATS